MCDASHLQIKSIYVVGLAHYYLENQMSTLYIVGLWGQKPIESWAQS